MLPAGEKDFFWRVCGGGGCRKNDARCMPAPRGVDRDDGHGGSVSGKKRATGQIIPRSVDVFRPSASSGVRRFRGPVVAD